MSESSKFFLLRQNGLSYLNSEPVHELHGPVAEGHVHVDGSVLPRKGSLHLQALALGRRKPLQLGWDVEGGGGGATQAEDVTEKGVGGLKSIKMSF